MMCLSVVVMDYRHKDLTVKELTVLSGKETGLIAAVGKTSEVYDQWFKEVLKDPGFFHLSALPSFALS